MEWLKTQMSQNKWVMLLVAACVIPFFTWQNMKERTAQFTYQLDANVSGVSVFLAPTGASIVYQDGTKLPADGLGAVPIAWEDHQVDPDRLKLEGWSPKQADFPVVAFFNPTGFDATGEPVIVRQAKDGTPVWTKTGGSKPMVQLVVPMRKGGFTIYDVTGKPKDIEDSVWYKNYMGVEPTAAQPPPQTPAQPPAQPEAEQVKPPVEPPKAKTGISGGVYFVGALGLSDVPIHVYKGKITPFDKFDAKDQRLVINAKTGAYNGFRIALPPGIYTVVVEVDGKMRGNALDRSVWPTVEVKDGWVDYDIRIVR